MNTAEQATEGRSAVPGAISGGGREGLDPRNSPSTSGSYTCGGCNNRWNGISRCHCAAAGCHQTFGGIGLFDRHRRDVKGVGTCLDPETIVSPKTGEREMYLTNGIWQSVEAPAVRKGFPRSAS